MSNDNELMDLKDQARLEFTQVTRENIVHHVLKEGIPESTEDRDLLMKALDGIDRNVVAKSKLKIDSRAKDNEQDTVRLISNLLARHTIQNNNAVRHNSPLLDDSIIIDDKVPGEDMIGVSSLTYEEFNKENF